MRAVVGQILHTLERYRMAKPIILTVVVLLALLLAPLVGQVLTAAPVLLNAQAEMASSTGYPYPTPSPTPYPPAAHWYRILLPFICQGADCTLPTYPLPYPYP